MALKLNAGLAKKVGQPNFGSLQVACFVEVELDSSLLQHDLDGFHSHVRNAYAACHQAVADELALQTRSELQDTSQQARGNGHSTDNGKSRRAGVNGGCASQKQLDYANQLAGRIQGLGVRRLETLANKLFGKPISGLSGQDASALIDTLSE